MKAKREDSFEILIDEKSVVKCVGDGSTMFALVRSLQECGKAPKFRVWDSELEDFTCWQGVGR